MNKKKVAEKLEFYTIPEPNSGCLIWIGPLHNKYGVFNMNYKSFFAHRIAWTLEYGEIPQDKIIMHKCDNRLCCNINHLHLGTPLENVADMVRKGRRHMKYKNRKNLEYAKCATPIPKRIIFT